MVSLLDLVLAVIETTLGMTIFLFIGCLSVFFQKCAISKQE
jgi:hypothetical protein